MQSVNVMLCVRTESEANLREHWAKRHRRSKAQREEAYYRFLHLKPVAATFPKISVTLTRVAPRKLDSDNLTRSMKAIRDGIADALGVNDGSSRIDWRYAQTKGQPKQYGVMVEIGKNV